MLYVRLVAAIASAYVYMFVLGKLKSLPPLKWLPNHFVINLILNAGGVVLFLYILLWPAYKEMKTTMSGLRQFAEENRFAYIEGEYQPDPSLLQSPLLNRGFRRSFGPAMAGKYRGVEFKLIYYLYSQQGGMSEEGDTRYFRTVVVYAAPEMHIPEFVMVKKSLGEKLFVSLFGGKHIDFPEDEAFSNHYALNGPQQDAIRARFSPALRLVFTASEKTWAINGLGNNLMLFTDEKIDEELKPEVLMNYLEETWKIASAIEPEIGRKYDE